MTDPTAHSSSKPFAIVLSILGVIIIGLTIAIVVMKANEGIEVVNKSDDAMGSSTFANKNTTLDCATAKDFNEILECTAATASNGSADSILILYNELINEAINKGDENKVAVLIGERAIQLVANGMCDQALASFDGNVIEKLSPANRAYIFSKASSVGIDCGAEDLAMMWQKQADDANNMVETE